MDIMTKFQYKTFVCDHDALQDLLTEFGLTGWRLHTCDPVATVGPQGSGILQAFVVLDRVIEEDGFADQETLVVDYEEADEGLAMKG
jgi:hypothetical protein